MDLQMSVLSGHISLTIIKEREVPVSLGQRYSFLGNISKPLWSAMIVPSSEVQWKLNVVSLILALNYSPSHIQTWNMKSTGDRLECHLGLPQQKGATFHKRLF